MNPNALPIGLAGGIAAALLFSAVLGGGALGLPLFALCPLPLAIAGLGWGTTAAVVAALVGAAGSAAVAGYAIDPASAPYAGLLFALLAGPTAWYAHLAGLARPVDQARPDAGLEWYPLGRVFLALTVGTILALIVAGAVIGIDVDAVAEAMADRILEMAANTGETGMPSKADMVEVARFYVRLMPATVTMVWLSLIAFDLWLAGRIVRISGRLRRPWTPVSEAVGLPKAPIAVFVVALFAAAVEGPVGLVAGAVAGGLAMAYALIGFAVVHVKLRAHPARQIILATLYGGTFLFSLPLIPIAIVGMADTVFGFRAKRLAAGAPPAGRP